MRHNIFHCSTIPYVATMYVAWRYYTFVGVLYVALQYYTLCCATVPCVAVLYVAVNLRCRIIFSVPLLYVC